MHIMTANGYRSIGGFAERIAADWAGRHEAITLGLKALGYAYATPIHIDDDHRVKHGKVMAAYSELSKARDALIGYKH